MALYVLGSPATRSQRVSASSRCSAVRDCGSITILFDFFCSITVRSVDFSVKVFSLFWILFWFCADCLVSELENVFFSKIYF